MARPFYLLKLALIGLLLLPESAIAGRRPEGFKDPKYWQQLCFMLTEKPTEALSACKQALEMLPGNIELWERYAALQFEQQQYLQAILSFEESLKRKPKNSAILYQQCLAWSALQNREKALYACDRAIQIDTNWSKRALFVAQHTRSLILDQPEEYQAALKRYDIALTKTPGDSLIWLYQGEILLRLERYSEAIAALNRAFQVDRQWEPETPDQAAYLQGLTNQKLERWKAAVHSFDRVLVINPNHVASWIQQGHSLLKLKRPGDAVTAFSRAALLQPQSSTILLAQCTAMNQAQQAEAALTACQKALQADQDWEKASVAQAWNQQAQALTLLGKLEEALAAVNRAVGISSDWAEAWSDRAVILWHLKRYDEAIASVKKAIALNPKDARAWANQGRIFRSLNQFQKAVDAYQTAVELDSQDAATWTNLSSVLWRLEDYGAALNAADRAIALDFKRVPAWQNRALALIGLEDYVEAQASYERMIAFDKTDAEGWAGLGLVLAKLKQYPAAIEKLQIAVQLNPAHTIARKALQASIEAQSAIEEKSQ